MAASIRTPGGEPCWWDGLDLNDKNLRMVARLYPRLSGHDVKFPYMAAVELPTNDPAEAKRAVLALYDVYLAQQVEVRKALEVAAQLYTNRSSGDN